MINRRMVAFTLIELLVATMLVAVLLGGVSLVVGGLARDQRVMRQHGDVMRDEPMMKMIGWDLKNATGIVIGHDRLTITGHGGIDPKTLTANDRAARVVYRVTTNDRGVGALVREQNYLDDAIRPEPWSDIVAVNVNGLDASAGLLALRTMMPERVEVRVEFSDRTIDQVLWTR